MAYYVAKFKNFKELEKATGFKVTPTGRISSNFSIFYLSLKDGRDPEDPKRVIKINEGFCSLYLVIKGKLTFTFYRDSEKEKEVLEKKECVYITPETEYEIKGSGEIAMITFPTFSDKTFSHPLKS